MPNVSMMNIADLTLVVWTVCVMCAQMFARIIPPPVCSAGRSSRGRTSGWRMADQL